MRRCDELDALLAEVIPAHTLADVPVGVFLSGGIDSALTAWYLQAPHTYSLGFEAKERSELAAARAAATHLGTVHTELTAQAAEFEQALDAIPRIFDEPFADSAAWSNYLIAQFARREVKVALSGEGGDEVFCGYPRYWSSVGARSSVLNRALARWLPPLSRSAASMQRHAYTGLPAFAAALGGMTQAQIEQLLGRDFRASGYDYLWFYRQFWSEGEDALVQLRWLDLHTALAEGLLTKVDRTSMAHSLEVRPPLLDHRLVEFMLSVDPALLVDRRRRRGKLLERRLMQPRLPAGHLDRPKSGFGLPVHRWLKSHPRRAARGGCALARAWRAAASGGPRVPPGVVAAGARPLVHGLWLSRTCAFYSCRCRVRTAWASSRAARRLRAPRSSAGRAPRCISC